MLKNKKNKIVILDSFTLNPGDLSWDLFNELGEITIYERTYPNEILQRIGDANIIFTNKVILNEEILRKSPNLEYIGVLAAGYNVVDLNVATELGIIVTNTPDYGSKGVAQMVFAHILEITNNVSLHSKSVKDGEWSKSNEFCYWKKPIIDLNNKTLGIIGLGNIGQHVLEIGKAFGMNILVHTRTEKPGIKNTPLNDLFKNSDIISLHCPLTEETKEIIRKENIDKMKDGVIIINSSRGPLINELDLNLAIKNGKVYAAGLDVLVKEPPLENNTFFSNENVNITPHIAWASKNSRKTLMNIAYDNLLSYLSGIKKNVVN